MIWGFLTALQTITLYIILISPVEYLLTEKYRYYKFINSRTKTLVFIGIFVLVFLFNQLVIKNKKYWLPITLLFILSLIGYYKYDRYYTKLQRIPTIYSVSSDWTIQGKKITIDGKNFGSPHDRAKVMVGDIEFLKDKWTSQEIVAHQPMTNDYGHKQLYIISENGEVSNKIPFEIRNPAELEN